MGLAASQARLLTITARKADCEFESMKLSHEKIALSRDMERISDQYQNAMTKTKLVYDYYGSGTSQMPLNYSLLMKPSIYNDYYPKLLTDAKNRVVLSSDYAFAARAAGIPAEGYDGTPSSEVRNKFVEALRDIGIISSATAATIESVSYNNGVGLGELAGTTATQDITWAKLLEIIKASCQDTADYGLAAQFHTPTSSGEGLYYPHEQYLSRGGDDDWNFRLSCDNGQSNQEHGRVMSVSLYDLLVNDPERQYTISLETGDGATIPGGEAAFAQQWLVGNENNPSFLNWMVDQFSSILGGAGQNDLALQYAYNEVFDLLYPNESIQEAAKYAESRAYATTDDEEDRADITKEMRSRYDFEEHLNEIATRVCNNYDDAEESEQVRNEALHYIGGTYDAVLQNTNSTSWWDKGGGRKECLAFNLNNIAKVFLTAFVEFLGGIENSPYAYGAGMTVDDEKSKAGKPKASLYDPNDDDIFTIVAPGSENADDSMLAGFYDALLNRICEGGWTENPNIDDAQYMQELLKTGAIFISSIDNDGCYYQSSYSTDTYIAEVADTEGIALAEAKYNAAKAKIENKENTIDLKMKNLDTEISSLDKEYDTMKNVINKAIEKSFKRYEV